MMSMNSVYSQVRTREMASFVSIYDNRWNMDPELHTGDSGLHRIKKSPTKKRTNRELKESFILRQEVELEAIFG